MTFKFTLSISLTTRSTSTISSIRYLREPLLILFRSRGQIFKMSLWHCPRKSISTQKYGRMYFNNLTKALLTSISVRKTSPLSLLMLRNKKSLGLLQVRPSGIWPSNKTWFFWHLKLSFLTSLRQSRENPFFETYWLNTRCTTIRSRE